LALAKEMLGYIRGKYSSIPIPGAGAEATLNASDLLSAAQNEKQQLVEELRTILDTMTRKNLLEAKKMETENLNSTLQAIPLKIYIG
jgi:aspartate/tyrosine/aromatic aminotransferase